MLSNIVSIQRKWQWKNNGKIDMKCNRVTSLDKYLTWVISMMSRKGFSMWLKKINNYQIWILKKKYIKSTRNWALQTNLQRPFSTMQCLTREMVKHVTVMDTVVFTATDHTTHVQYCTVKMPDLSCDFHVMWLSEYNILHSTELVSFGPFFP